MATLRFLLKRFMAQRSLGLAVVITMAFSIGVFVSGPLYADASREAILSSVLSAASVTARNARFQIFVDPSVDYAATDATITDAVRMLPLDRVIRQGLSTVRLGGEAGPSAPIFFRDGADEHLEIVGSGPGVDEIALSRTTARSLRVRSGEMIEVVGPTGLVRSLVVSGTFEAPALGAGAGRVVLTDRAAARSAVGVADEFWFDGASPFPAPGTADPQPVLVSRDTYLTLAPRIELSSTLVWDAYLTLEGAPYLAVRTFPARIAQVARDLSTNAELADLDVATGLGTQLSIVDDRIANLQIPILLVVFQIGAVTLAVLTGVGSLSLTRQSFELAVLHSRGFSRGRLLVAQSTQAFLAGAVALPLGLAAGMGLAKLASLANGSQLPGVRFPVRLSAVALWMGAGTAFIGAVILLLLSIPLVRRTVLQERRALSREQRPLLARVPVELVVLPVGVLAYVQLLGNAEPVPGSGTIDPLVLLAPTLLLFAASFLSLRLLLLVLRRFDRTIGRSRSVPRYLALRRLARSPGDVFAAALLLLLSMGLLVVTTSYREIVQRNHDDSAHQQVGADWRIDVAPPEQVLAAVRDLPAGTTPVVRTAPRLEGGIFVVPEAIAIDPATYAAGGWWREDYASRPLREILDALQTPDIGLPLRPSTQTLEVQIRSPRTVSGASLQVTFERPDGIVTTPPMQPLRIGPGSYMFDVSGGARLLSVTIVAPLALDLDFDLELDVDALSLDGEPVDLSRWEPLTWRGGSGTLEPNGNGARYQFHPGPADVIGGIVPSRDPVPALVAPDVLRGLGDSFTATLGGQQVELRVIGTALQFPSTTVNSPFIVVSSLALLQRQASVPDQGLSLNEVWGNGPNPAPALRRRGLTTGDVFATAPILGALAQLPQSLAVGLQFTAAVAGLGLVIIGVAVGLYFAQRRRDYEFAALRAMGVRPRQVLWTLATEQASLLVFAVAIGLGVGYGILRIVMPVIGPSLSVRYPPPLLVVDELALVGALVAITVTTGVGLALSTRFLVRSSVTGVLRGEAE